MIATASSGPAASSKRLSAKDGSSVRIAWFDRLRSLDDCDSFLKQCSKLADDPMVMQARAIRKLLAAGRDRAGIRSEEVLEAARAAQREYRTAVSNLASEPHVELDHASLVELLMEENRFATMRDTGEVYVYVEGVYRPHAEAAIAQRIEDLYRGSGKSAKQHLVNEVVHAVRRRTYRRREDFNPAGKMCLRNGILDLEALTVAPHSPDGPFTIHLPVSYDAEAVCPKFETFLKQVVPDPMDRETLQRMAGYCFERGNPHQVAFMLFGSGDNGKSTFLRVLAEMLGRRNVASEPLQVLTDNRFAAASLWDKLANVCADIPATGIKSTGMFKQLTGGDLVRAEKKFLEAFYFENPAKLIFSANVLPDVNDRTVAFWRRWRPGLVRFPVNVNTLPGGKDPHLLAKLLMELPGILNWSLEGLRRLREAGGFSEREGDLEREWRQRADSLYWFVSERVKKDPNGRITKDDLFEQYRQFCDEHEVRAKTKEQVGQELVNHLPFVRSERPRIGVGGTQVHCWTGIAVVGSDESAPEGEQKTLPESGESGETGLSHLGGKTAVGRPV